MRLLPAAALVAVWIAWQAAAPQVDVTRLGPQVGESVPALDLADPHGRRHTLASVAGPKGTMLVFFRSADW